MDDARRSEIERKGGTVATAAEWLGLDDVDREVIEFRVIISREIRRRRAEAGLTQADFAARIGLTRPAMAKIENGQGGIGRLMAAFFALGGKVADLGALTRW